MKTTNLDEPGANLDQLFELAINLKNARTFAGKSNGDDDWDWRKGNWWDLEDDDAYDWEREPELETKAQGTKTLAQKLANGGVSNLTKTMPPKKGPNS